MKRESIQHITKQNVLQAIARIKEEGVPSARESNTYDLVYEGVVYPPKYITSLAGYFSEKEQFIFASKFSGGEESLCFSKLRELDFDILPKAETKKFTKPNEADRKMHYKYTYRVIDEKLDEVKGDKWINFWRNSVWVTSGWLWWVWLSHDVANIAVYLPRQLDVSLLLIVLAYFSILIFYIFYIHGGPIQKVVLDKTGTRYARSATIINVIYAAVLYYFKELNDIPMSTTWVFVGLLCGRELAISTMNKDYKFKYVFPLIGKDFAKMIFGLSVSVAIVLAIHYYIIPKGFY